MFKHLLLFVVVLLCPIAIAIADDNKVLCPTVDKIRQGEFSRWLPLYKDSEELASENDVKQFRKNVVSFKMARWSTQYAESAHCFYQGLAPIVDKIVFARHAWRPEENRYWYWEKRRDYLAECQDFPNCIFLLSGSQ